MMSCVELRSAEKSLGWSATPGFNAGDARCARQPPKTQCQCFTKMLSASLLRAGGAMAAAGVVICDNVSSAE